MARFAARIVLALVLAIFSFHALSPYPAQAQGYTVNAESDEDDASPSDGACLTTAGKCTQRAAIEESNRSVGVLDTITFAVPMTINVVGGALPEITDPVVIDAPVAVGGGPQVVLRGSSAGVSNGLVISAGGSTVRGLAIGGFGLSGVVLKTKGGNHIEGTYVGINQAGDAAAVVLCEGSRSTTIVGNLVGTDRTGTLALGNTYDGIVLAGHPQCTGAPSETTIGGGALGPCARLPSSPSAP